MSRDLTRDEADGMWCSDRRKSVVRLSAHLVFIDKIPCKMGRHIILLDGSDVNKETGPAARSCSCFILLSNASKHDQAVACERKSKSKQRL